MSLKSRSPEISEYCALLAPVPERHLVSGIETLAKHGQVWFGSDTIDVFEELKQNGAKSFVALIYASISKYRVAPSQTHVTWVGRYVGYAAAIPGSLPEYRPTTTETDTDFKLWWKLDFLRRLDDSDSLPMHKIGAPTSNKRYLPNFAPERPLRVRADNRLLGVVKAWMREQRIIE